MTYNQGGYPPQGGPSGPQSGYAGAPQGAPKAGGYLYPNEKKQRAEQPDQKGKIKIGEDIVAAIMGGQREFYISGWNKQDQRGGKFLSVNLKVIEAKPQGGYGGGPQQQWAPQPPTPQWAPPPHAGHGGHAVAPMPPQYPHQGPPPQGTSWNTPQHVPATGPGRPQQVQAQGIPQGYNPMDQEIPF